MWRSHVVSSMHAFWEDRIKVVGDIIAEYRALAQPDTSSGSLAGPSLGPASGFGGLAIPRTTFKPGLRVDVLTMSERRQACKEGALGSCRLIVGVVWASAPSATLATFSLALEQCPYCDASGAARSRAYGSG